MLVWIIASLLATIACLTVVDAARRPHSRLGLTLWVLLVVLVPVVGAAIYWLLRGPERYDAARGQR